MIAPLWGLMPIMVLGPALSCVAPRSMALLYVLSAVAFLALDAFQNRRLPHMHQSLGLLFGSVILYGFASYFWSINPQESLGKAAQFILAFLPTVLLVPAVRRFTADDLNRVGIFMVCGLALGLGVYMSEVLTHFYLYDLIRGGFSPDSEDVRQNKAAVLLALWLYAALPWFFYRAGMMQRGAGAAALLLVAYATYESESSSAVLILGFMPFLALALWILPARVALVLATASILMFSAASPLLARAAYDHTPWLTTEALSTSFKARVEMWNQIAHRVAEKPMLGWGLDSSPVMPNRDEYSRLPGRGHIVLAHLHPHNAPMQVWFELGAVGIAALSALFMLFYRGIRAMPDMRAQKYAVFMWCGVFLYTLTIWGIWQSWFVATLCFMGLMTYAGARYISARQTL